MTTDEQEVLDVEATPALAESDAPPPALVEVTPLSIIRELASNPNCDVEKIERLVGLQERTEDRAASRSYGEAVAKFQAECPIIKKGKYAGKEGSSFGYAYAGFDDIMHQIRPLLAECGLSISFSSDLPEPGKIHVTVTIRHGTHSEQSEFTCPVPVEMKVNQTQKMGAALSYAKRYALCGALNITTSGEDYDGAPPSARPDQDPDAPDGRTREDRAAAPTMAEAVQACIVRWWPFGKTAWPEEDDAALLVRFKAYVEAIACRAVAKTTDWNQALVNAVNARLDASIDPRPVVEGEA